jgi:hypothetical protein
MGLFSFKQKTDEVLNHWIAFAESFSFAPQEFYQLIEKELAERKIPGLKLSPVEYSEGGLLSDQRLYLRMIRERLAFDLCAAPFGSGFFFSCRSVYSPVVLRFWHVLAVLIFFNLTFGLLFQFLGFKFAIVAEVALLLAISQVFRNTGRARQFDLDAAILKIPAFGPIYERWFRADTYYRQDTRLVYLETVPKLVKELAEEITATKGVKLVRQYESAPVLGELYRPLASRKELPAT